MGGLNIPCISTLHKRLQVSRQAQLLTSADACVRYLAEKGLQKDFTLSRTKFRASVVVRDAMVTNPDFTRKSLCSTAKALVQESANEARLREVQVLEKQGQMWRSTTPRAPSVWAKALHSLPEEHMKFALNSALDTLPHNMNLHLWNKRESDNCPLCGEKQSLVHILNACRVARDARRYNIRHDAVLEKIALTISNNLPANVRFTSDLGNYNFPQHVVATDLRPDLVWWDESSQKLWLAELTVCFETSFLEAAERKEVKYTDLKERAENAGYYTTLLTLEVGSRGIVNINSFDALKAEISLPEREFSGLLQQVAATVLSESHRIWCSRNKLPNV